ncbi:MAG: cytochrome c, partial [Candidatus Obscuribacterales bacterium]|nr:cytochrome c [Candidatus Obscuribacterales bacterium]
MSRRNPRIKTITETVFVLGGLILTASLCLTAVSKETGAHQIKPLFGKITKADRDSQELNQCPGTMERYSFPPSGYEPRKRDSQSARGERLYAKLNCKQCHSQGGTGGEMGPPLDGIGGHRGREWLIDRLIDPEKQMQKFSDVFGGRPNIMPHIGASKRQAKDIADYLLTLPEPEGGFAVEAHPRT